jgi:2-dehydro-3-deoxygluconokinase
VGVLHGLLRSADDLDGAAKSGLALTALKHSLPGDASLFGQGYIDAFLSGEFDVRR